MTVYTKSGLQTSHREFSSLFAPATNVFCPDPRVIYWSWNNRYAIVCTDLDNQMTRLAISASGNPNGSWVTYSTGPNTAVDQPKVEVTKDKLVVAGNAAPGSVFWVYQLSDLLSRRRTPGSRTSPRLAGSTRPPPSSPRPGPHTSCRNTRETTCFSRASAARRQRACQ
ncbi:MAG TPA: hypothetical protein VG013_24980 [Gemmataceae bacterium]|nr:hypothetical protein [Gemmataceae bacterium]